MILLCKDACAPLPPLSKGRGPMPPSCTLVPTSLTTLITVICFAPNKNDQKVVEEQAI